MTLLLPRIGEAQINRAGFIDSSFILFWPSPVRAHPGVPLDFRFSVYEVNNERLTWQLTGAPGSMAVDSLGKVDWTPSASDAGNYPITVRVTRASGGSISRNFSLSVNTTDFVFVSTTGRVGAAGTMADPHSTIEAGMRSIQGSDGKTLYIRGGTYPERYEWETNGVQAPFRGKNFSPADPMEVRGYPGERAILDCGSQGHGFWSYGATYVIFSNVEVQNAGSGEKAGIGLDAWSVAKDAVVHDSHWASGNNCTGFKSQAPNVLFDRCVGYNNFDPGNRNHWNSSNFLVYNDVGSGTIHILNSLSYGSMAGFKIKHAGPAKLILHNSVSRGDNIGFGLGSDLSSVRYCVSNGSFTGIFGGIADPNAYSTGRILVEHNTVVNASEYGLFVQDGYLTGGNIVRNNIFFNNVAAAGTAELDRRLMAFWIYDANAATRPLDSDRNVFHSPSQNNIIRLGNSNPNYSFATWRSTALHDMASVFGDPLFTASSTGNFSIPIASPADFGSGEFAGAFPPGATTAIRFREPDWHLVNRRPETSGHLERVNLLGRKLKTGVSIVPVPEFRH